MPDRTVFERTCALDPAGISAREARRFVRALLQEASRDEWLDATELAVSEIVTNVVLHAHTAFEVTARVSDDHVRVEVRDGNPTLPAQRSYDEQATTGRGMDLVAAVTTAHGVHSLGGDGKVVWFCVGGADADDALLDEWDDAGWEMDAPPEAQPAGVPVELRRMPATLWLATHRHHDALLRELTLYRVMHPCVEGEPEDFALADEARSLITTAVTAAVEQAGPEARPAPAPRDVDRGQLPAVPDDLDLVLHVRPEQAAAFAALQDALDNAERLAVSGALLVRPGLPEVIAVRDWACEQVIAQLAGTAPKPWPGTDAEAFTTMVRDGLAPVESGWDTSIVRDADRGAIAADDANRIVAVSRPLADALGWEVEDLVGRRIITLVPPRFREAHVAGFTRHLTTGETNVLGTQLKLPALRHDGSEVMCDVLIESHGTASGRSVYVAWMTPEA